MTATHSHNIQVYNTAALMKPHTHGFHDKHLMVLHETVSHDYAGLADILGVERDLAKRDYGIHGMTDAEGHMAWARGLGNAVFYHAGGVNEISCGIENVSWIPTLLQQKLITNEHAWKMWMARERQLDATAKLIAAWHNSDKKNHPIRYVNGTGNQEGVTSHWDVSQYHPESQGHSDCHPHHHGGYYPILLVIAKASVYAQQGYEF